MKRIFRLLLISTLVMVLCVNVSAAEITQPGNATSSITASLYDPGDTVIHKYDVTIGWENTGSVVYSLTTNTYTWNSDTLEYEVEVDETAKWIISEDAAVNVIVTNRSDLPVEVYCAKPVLVPGTGVTSLSGHYGANENATSAVLEISSAANGFEVPGTARTGSVNYHITGIEGAITTDTATIATITITITVPNTSEP